MIERYSVLMALAPWEASWVVAEALDSLARQTLPPEAVVLSCDGPPSEQLNQTIVASGLPITVVMGPGGEGAGPALQRGLLACPTSLVVRADADDVNAAHRCERQVMEMDRRPELAALGCWIEEFSQRHRDAPRVPLGERRPPCGLAKIRRYGRWRNPLNHPGTILRREWVSAAGGYRAMESFEDYDLWLRLLAGGWQIDNLPETLVLARVDPERKRRRRGRGYALAEIRFAQTCATEGLMERWVALLWMLLRCPLRLLPATTMAGFMRRWLRHERVRGQS